MMNQHQTALVSLLLGSFPTFQSGDAAAALAAYEIVLNEADERDLQPGIVLLINGQHPSHDGRFAPTSSQLAGAIRVARDRRLDAEIRNRKPALPPPDVVHTPESRARIAAMANAYIAKASEHMRTEDAERDARQRDLSIRTDARLGPDMSPRAVRKRLGFSLGDQDDEAAA